MSSWRCTPSPDNSFGFKHTCCAASSVTDFINQMIESLCPVQTSLTGRSASSRSSGGSGMRGSKLLRLLHGDSSKLLTMVTGCLHVTLPGASPAGTGVPASGCDWAGAAGS